MNTMNKPINMEAALKGLFLLGDKMIVATPHGEKMAEERYQRELAAEREGKKNGK